AGASFGNGYGPYTLKHGESVKIVVAQAAAGMGWEAGEAVGKQYKADRNTLKKNTEVFKGVDSLFTTFKRATDNYNKGWNLQNPPKPPESFSVSGLEKEIMLNWSISADPDIQGFQIFRASGKRDAKYEMIAEVAANERSYRDTSVSEGENYYYNIRSIGKAIQADSALKLPSTRLTSSRFSTQTYDPASIGTSGINDRKISLADYKLFDNYPNPFNPVTIIKYNVPFESSVRLNVYNMLGEKICELENSLKKAGVYEVEFKASNLPSGIYFYSIEASSKGRETFISAKKMMLLK
ncbi:MAG: T9SS type A sorting domain-containing protein, partial [Bacteroidota bacterium]|nr:T9SS type A sorting domain-containing protein [Bacteroidota bacterium]